MVVDARAVKALLQQVLEPDAQLGVEAVARERDEDRNPALLQVGADEELDVLALLEVE